MSYVINSVKCLVCIQSSTSIKIKKSNGKDITVQFFLLEVQYCNSLENDVKSMFGKLKYFFPKPHVLFVDDQLNKNNFYSRIGYKLVCFDKQL